MLYRIGLLSQLAPSLWFLPLISYSLSLVLAFIGMCVSICLFFLGKLNRDPVAVKGRLPFRIFWLEIKWNGPFRFGPTAIFGTRFEGGPLCRSAHFGRSDRNVPFHLTKLLTPVPLFCILLMRTIDLFSLLVLFSQYRSCVNTLENCFFQILSYSTANVSKIYDKTKG